jgi:hypothetical protein
MATELELTKREFLSQYNSLYRSDQDLAIEDCKFQIFTDLLFDFDILNSPSRISRKTGVHKRANWSILGYTTSHIHINSDDELEITDDSEINLDNNHIQGSVFWEYQIINGYFSDDLVITKSTKEEISKTLNETIKFIEATLEGNMIRDLCEAAILQEEIIQTNKDKALEKIEIIIITDKIIDQENLKKNVVIKENLKINIQYWDLIRLNDLKRNRSKRIPITIDFSSDDYSSYNIKYIKHNVSDSLCQYLAIFPGDLIADLYFEYNTKLLENNVRVFLSANRKANLAMRKSIKDKPEHFFSFNNGLSATAEKIHFKDESIIKIVDFQIVNGGQTTATLHYASKHDRNSLSNIYVPVKITELRRDLNYSETVNSISKAANTQTAIKSSDFYANDLFLVELERLAQKNPVDLKEEGFNSYYFFERMSGQYNVTMNHTNKNSRRKSRIEAWVREHRKELSFTKIEVARWFNCINGLPHVAASSAEKQFENFMEDKDFKKTDMHLGNFKTLIGFGILFNRIRKLVGTKTGKEYPSLIDDSSVGMATTIYAATYFHLLTEGKFDYWAIYNHEYNVVASLITKERVKTEIDEILIHFILESWNRLKQFGKTSTQEKSKSLECWLYFKNTFKLKNEIKELLSAYLISSETKKFRENYNLKNDDKSYFEKLSLLLINKGRLLKNLENISSRESNYKVQNSKVNNFIRRIENGELPLVKNKVFEIVEFYNTIIEKGYNFDDEFTININNIDCLKIYETIIKDLNSFQNMLENYITRDENTFKSKSILIDEFSQVKIKIERDHGLSFKDLELLFSLTNIF